MKTAFSALALLLCLAGTAQTTTPSITTSGVAHVYAVPDEVVIDVYIRNEFDDMSKASEATDRQAKEVLALCKEFGIAKEHAQSRHRRYGKNWRHKVGQPKFEASQTINICLKDLSRYDEFMKSMIAIEVHSVSGATFRTTKHREHMDEARFKAMLAAKEKATLMAGALEQTIGKASNIQESVTQYGRTLNAYANTTSQAEQGGGSDGSSFAPGQIKIEANVQVTFALE